jgi:ATPases involved in chromosome partitioning
MTQEQTCLCR